jgi:hypothetical protein
MSTGPPGPAPPPPPPPGRTVADQTQTSTKARGREAAVVEDPDHLAAAQKSKRTEGDVATKS